jgi:hypothetical protein
MEPPAEKGMYMVTDLVGKSAATASPEVRPKTTKARAKTKTIIPFFLVDILVLLSFGYSALGCLR